MNFVSSVFFLLINGNMSYLTELFAIILIIAILMFAIHITRSRNTLYTVHYDRVIDHSNIALYYLINMFLR